MLQKLSLLDGEKCSLLDLAVLKPKQYSIDESQRHVGKVLAVSYTRNAANDMRERFLPEWIILTWWGGLLHQ
jgi:hypothetical protein